jgi:hypothetical protein
MIDHNAILDAIHDARAELELEDRDSSSVGVIEKITERIEARAVEWVRLHVSGIAAPNDSDLEEMRAWMRGAHPYQAQWAKEDARAYPTYWKPAGSK